MVAVVRENREMLGNKKFGQGIREISGTLKVGQGKLKCERICNLKKLFSIEKIFDDFLALLDFVTEWDLRGERFMSNCCISLSHIALSLLLILTKIIYRINP